MLRTVEEWMEILMPLAAEPDEAAKRILGDLVHYRRPGGGCEDHDSQQLANAMEALVNLARGTP